MFGYNKEKWKELNGINTAKEIFNQPDLWLETLDTVDFNKEKINRFMERRLNKDNLRVIFTGAGTSAYVGDIVTPYLNKDKKIDFQSIPTTDIVANPKMYLKKDIPTIMVSFARSGNSPESVAAYELSNEVIDDISHIFITCNKDGQLAEISKNNENILLLLMPERSNDKGFAMTSSFSCMTIAALMVFDINNFEDNKNQVIEMETIGKGILDNGYRELEELLTYNYDRIVYLGSGSFYGLSKESGLKLLELTRGQITSLSESVLGFRHGPKSIVNDSTLIFIYISKDEYSRKYDLDLLNEVYQDLGEHKVISISSNYDKEVEEISDYHLYLNEEMINVNNEVLIALLYALYAQIFALLSSVQSGVEPDDPNPSGLVNRVVKGVIIHKFSKNI